MAMEMKARQKLKNWLDHEHNLGNESEILKNKVSDDQWGKSKDQDYVD